MTWLKVSMGVFLVLGLLAIGLVASDQAYAGSETATLGVTMQVKGMTCGDCATKVQASLLEVPGVKSADVSLEKNEAKVEYEKEKVTLEQLVAAVKKAGYEAHSKE
jgi:copper chaperone CopZ